MRKPRNLIQCKFMKIKIFMKTGDLMYICFLDLVKKLVVAREVLIKVVRD